MQTLSTDTCPTCKTPRSSDKINYYDGELRLFQSAAKAQCPRCSFVLRCVVWASANDILELSDVQKIRVWAGGSLSVYLRRRYVMLEVFTLESRWIVSLATVSIWSHDPLLQSPRLA